jgi:uncharacterized protein YbjT (DUF2867 family)
MATTTSSPNILVTGATGNIGKELVQQLDQQGIPFRVLVRSAAQAAALSALPQAQPITGDFNDARSIRAALEGMEKVFLLTPSSELAEQQQLHFTRAAKEAGVEHIVKLSQFAAGKQSPVRFLRYHAVVEEAIRQSDLAYTFLRPNLFMQALLGFRDLVVQQRKFFASIGDAKVSLVDTRDIAAVAAVALTQPGHAGKTYQLTGPQALSHAEIAALLSAAVGYTIQFIDVPAEYMHQALLAAGFPAWQAAGLVEDYGHYGRGEAAEVYTDIQDITGRPARSFSSFAGEYAHCFQGAPGAVEQS